MSVKVASNRFIVSSISKSAALYQHLIQANSSLEKLGQLLTREAEQAQEFRHTKRLEELGAILAHFPLREFQVIGQYHLGWCAYQKGKDARPIFESVIENSATYRPKALIDIATLELRAGNCDLGVKSCAEAIRQSHNISTIINAARSTAVIKAAEGFHASALKDLEAIAPLIRYASPIVCHQYLNSLAVELGEVGRVEEATNICKVVLASPFINAYPEWRETRQDLALRGYRSRSSVRIIQSFPRNVSYMPEREPSAMPVHSAIFGSAPVVGLKEWKEEKMVKEPNGDEFDNMTEKDLVIKIFQMAAEEGMTWKKLRKIIDYIDKVYSEPDE